MIESLILILIGIIVTYLIFAFGFYLGGIEKETEWHGVDFSLCELQNKYKFLPNKYQFRLTFYEMVKCIEQIRKLTIENRDLKHSCKQEEK